MKTIILCLLFTSFVTAGEIYKWTDENGNVHFGDRPANLQTAETVEIREQKTGSMVSSQTMDRMTEKPVYEPTKTAVNGAVNNDNSRACDFAKGILQQRELKLSQLKRRGYKQYERAEAEADIETWSLKVKHNCN